MISYITASHRPEVLAANLEATLQLADDDELIVLHNPDSIAAAYNHGQAKASNPVRCYIHHDVQVLAPMRLRAALLEECAPDVGLVGLIGSVTPTLPWWEGVCRGSVVDARMGRLDFAPGGDVAYLDGLLLATVQQLDWDEQYGGFHLYDHDMCQQQLAAGRRNVCLTGGADMVRHNTTNSADTAALAGWSAGVARFRAKWGMP